MAVSNYTKYERFYHKGPFPDRGPITLVHIQAPGDALVLTGFLRDLERAHPGRFQVDGIVRFDEIIKHNPYVTARPDSVPVRNPILYKVDYGYGIKEQKSETIHFMSYFHRHFERLSGLRVPVTDPFPDLHFGLDENEPIIEGRYWVVNAGGKTDVTTKIWEKGRFQAVVDTLADRGIRCVQVGNLGGSQPKHLHSPLTGVVDLLGKTNLRQLMRLIRDSDGVICGVTMVMHMAAALQRPCVVIAGGRESWYWEAYTRENSGLGPNAAAMTMPHRFKHTIGLLECCRHHGCWRSKVTDGQKHADKSLCLLQAPVGNKWYPACMQLIEPQHVVESVMSYYEDKSLPPIIPSSDVPKLLENLQVRNIVPTVRVSRNSPDGRLLIRQGEHKVFVPDAEPKPVFAPRPEPGPPDPADVWDHPILGGKVTFCILMYGDFAEMHRRCLDSVLTTVPKERRTIFVGSNALCPASIEYVTQLVESGDVEVHFRHASNDRKYPVMREMFRSPQHPIRTEYLIWLDDDTFCDKDRLWFSKLGECIVKYHPTGDRCFGPLRFFKLTPSQQAAYRQSNWYKRRPWSGRSGQESPNETHVPFASGSFWALHTASMRQADVPDERLQHNGGDYAIGAQLWQNRFGMRGFSSNKELVQWSAVTRRGLHEKHFGT